MHIAPPEAFQTASSEQSSQNQTSHNQHGTKFVDEQASDSHHDGRLVGEPIARSDTPDNLSVASSTTSRGRRSDPGRLSTNRQNSNESSPGSRIDAYERANAIPRRPSDGVVFQLVPSGKDSSDTTVLDLPNEVLTHILSHLPPESLSLMSLVNTRFHRLVTTPPAWRIAFARFFPGAESVAPAPFARSEEDAHTSTRRSFCRVSALASWRSEYILRTRLLRSLSRGRPAMITSGDKSYSKNKTTSTATIMYNSGLMYPVSHIHANFGVGLNKKQPLFVHGAVEQGLVSASDPANGRTSAWGLSDFEAFKHFADLYSGEAPHGLGAGDIVGMSNVMSISQPFGKLYGEACPGGRLFFTSTSEPRGRFLMVSSPANYALGIPEVSSVNSAITSVWLAKSEAVLKVSNGLLGALAGSSIGILSAYAVGASPVHDRRFDRGELTARWAICPGVPIVAIDVDEKVSSRRLGRRRIWAAVLNALGEVFYLLDPPVRQETRGKLSDADLDRLAWQTGRSTEWLMVESSRRVAKIDPFQAHSVDGSYSPRSSGFGHDLSPAQLEAEAKEIEQFLKQKPKHFQSICNGWECKRSLAVDYGGDDHHGGGESIVVINHGGEDHLPATIRRFTKHRTKVNHGHEPDPFPPISMTGPQISTPFSQISSVVSSPGFSAPRSRTSSSDDIGDKIFHTTWHMSEFAFGNLKNPEISAIAIDDSDFALLSATEDPLLGMSGGSETSSPLASPLGQVNIAATASDIPGHRARFFGVGTTSGIVLIWDVRAPSSAKVDVVDTVLPVRVIYTRSPQISSLAMTSLYVVHGGNDGLVQAWDPLASTSDPIRTLNSRFSDRARRRMAQAEASVQGVGINYFAAGAIALDPDPSMLRGMVSLGTHLRYWSYSASAADAYKSKKRNQLRRRSDRGSNAAVEKYHHTGRGVLRDYIADERHELEREKTVKRKENERLENRFGTTLLGEGASEEEMLAYALMVSEESYASDETKRRASPLTAPQQSSSKQPTGDDLPPSDDADLEEAIRLSLLDTPATLESPPATDFDVPIRFKKSSRHGTPKKSRPARNSPPRQARSTSEDDLEFALQLSLAEQESSRYQDDFEFPALAKSHSGSSVEGKGKGRKH